MERVGENFQDQLNKQDTGYGKGVEEIAHHTSSMAGMKDPTKHFCKSIRNTEDTRDMMHDNIFSISPILKGRMLNIDDPSVGTQLLIMLIVDMLSS